MLRLFSFPLGSFARGQRLYEQTSLTHPFSLVGRRREGGKVFHTCASYVSYGFMVARGLKVIGAIGRIVIEILFGLSQGCRFIAAG